MLGIFGADLFAGEGAAEVLGALLGLDEHKPFECVGTKEETLAALYLCVEKYKAQGLGLPAALGGIEESVLSKRKDLPEVSRRVFGAWSKEHHPPPELVNTCTTEPRSEAQRALRAFKPLVETCTFLRSLLPRCNNLGVESLFPPAYYFSETNCGVENHFPYSLSLAHRISAMLEMRDRSVF